VVIVVVVSYGGFLPTVISFGLFRHFHFVFYLWGVLVFWFLLECFSKEQEIACNNEYVTINKTKQ